MGTDADDPLHCVVWGRLKSVTKELFVIWSWDYEDASLGEKYPEHRDGYQIVKGGVITIERTRSYKGVPG